MYAREKRLKAAVPVVAGTVSLNPWDVRALVTAVGSRCGRVVIGGWGETRGGGAKSAGLNFRFFPHARPDVRRTRISFRYFIHTHFSYYLLLLFPTRQSVRYTRVFRFFITPRSPETNTKTYYIFCVRFCIERDLHAYRTGIGPPDENARSTDSARYGHGEIPTETVNHRSA